MGAASNDRRGRWLLGVFAGLLLVGGASCATSGGEVAGADRVAVLRDVEVEQRGEDTVVHLRGVGKPLYTVVPEDEGSRLVMSLGDTRSDGLPDGIAPVTGLVDEVEIVSDVGTTGEPYTRLALHLGEAVDHEVLDEGEDLAVRIWPRRGLEQADTEEGWEARSTPLAEMEPEEAFVGEDRDPSTGGPAAEPEETAGRSGAGSPEVPMATTLVGVEASADGVRLVADGRLAERESFALEDPPRLVIDLPGVEVGSVPNQVAVEDGRIARVRVGRHADKVRVVLDGTSDATSLADWELETADDGLRVAPATAGTPPVVVAEADADESIAAAAEGLDSEETSDGSGLETQASEEAGEAQSAATEETKETRDAGDAAAAGESLGDAGLTVSGLSLRTGDGVDGVRISTTGEASYQLYKPDSETVVVSLPDAVLSSEADSRIVAEPGGPISLVMAFEQPGTEAPEVRVVINRAAGAEPKVRREGSDVVVSFPEGTGIARTPPALNEEPDGSASAETPSTASAKALAQATRPGPASLPAAPSPEEQGIEVLQEGGLLEGKEYAGRRISLDFKDVEIDDVLRLIAEVSDLNIIAGDNVSGTVTIRLVDVPWDQALDVILMTKGLGFRKVGNVLRIAPKNLIQQEEESRLQERRAKEKLEDLIVKFQPVNYASVNDVAKMVQRLLSARGTVDTDPRTNTVILKDIPSVVDESVALIKAIDTPTPQVLIEAKIVEANLDFSRELGMVWGFGIQQFNDGFDTGSGIDQSRGSESFRFRPDAGLVDPSGPAGDLNNFVIQNPISQASDANALVNLGAFLLDEQFNLEAQLQAAEATGEGKVVSSPRVVTLDNREAEIQQGVAIPFQTFENGDAQLQFVDAVLELKVKPHITADRSIIMELEVSRNAPDDSVATNTGTPGISKNETETETLVRDGQTLVIGGIYTIQKSDRENRVPYLHSIPGLGNLFKSRSVRDIRQELLIFVTPRIVELPELGS